MKKDVSAYFRKIGKQGGKKRWAKTSKKERSEHARKMALVRHNKSLPTVAA